MNYAFEQVETMGCFYHKNINNLSVTTKALIPPLKCQLERETNQVTPEVVFKNLTYYLKLCFRELIAFYKSYDFNLKFVSKFVIFIVQRHNFCTFHSAFKSRLYKGET